MQKVKNMQSGENDSTNEYIFLEKCVLLSVNSRYRDSNWSTTLHKLFKLSGNISSLFLRYLLICGYYGCITLQQDKEISSQKNP